jgi:predicted peptidase
MKIFHKLLILFSVIILFFNCNKNEDLTEPQTTTRTAEDVREDFKNLVINPGINDFTLESPTENIFWNFRIIKPVGASNTNKRPLVFHLHGGASNLVPDAHKSTECLASPGFEALDAIIISPNSNGKLWYDPSNQIQVLALLELVSTYLPVDTNKKVIMGYSDGGNGSFFFAKYFPTLFSAAIPMATSFNPANTSGVVDKINIPIYAIHGSEDQLFPIDITQGYINKLFTAGTDIQFVTATGLDHYHPCDYVSYVEGAAQWLINSVWN